MTADSTLAGYLDEATRLWPGRPAQIVRAGALARRPEGTYRMAVVPTLGSPRLLVPGTSPRAASAALLRFSSALGPREVLTRAGYAALLRAGLGGRLPQIEVLEGGHSLRSHLADVLGEPVEVSLGLGTARANRKPVLEVFDRRGRRLAFAKVGTTPVSTALVEAEGAALAALGGVDLAPAVLVPALIDLRRWQGLTVLLMSVLPSAPSRPGSDPASPRAEAEALSTAFPGAGGRLEQSTWWARLTRVATGAGPAAARLADALAWLRALDEQLAEPMERGAWHGDWTPWNQSRTPHGLAVWDWERFETDVPCGLDVCHFFVNTATRREGASIGAVDAGLRRAGLEPGRPADARLAAAYLLTMAERYLVDGQAATGPARAVVAQRADIVVGALTTWLGSPTTTERR